MRLEDFAMLLDEAHMLDKQLLHSSSPRRQSTNQADNKFQMVHDVAVRDVRLAFTRSLMTRRDELSGQGHKALTFVEFLEAVGRIAELRPIILPMVRDPLCLRVHFAVCDHTTRSPVISLCVCVCLILIPYPCGRGCARVQHTLRTYRKYTKRNPLEGTVRSCVRVACGAVLYGCALVG